MLWVSELLRTLINMIKNQKFVAWFQEQPLIRRLVTKDWSLAGVDRERELVLLGAPILAMVLVVGSIPGYALTPSPERVAYTAVEDTPDSFTSALDSTEPTQQEQEEEAIDPIAEAIALWGEPDLAAILSEEFPGAQWSLNGNTYEGLVWIGPGAKPTEETLLRLWNKVGEILAERRVVAEEEAAEKAAEQQAQQEARAADPTRQELCRAIDYKALYGPGVDYTKVLSVHYPGAQWTLNGDAYSGLTWISPGTKPTKATLDSLWDGVAFQLCLQKPMSELTARAGTSDTEEYVDGVARPKGYSDGTFTPTLATCNQLPQLPADTFTGGSAEVPQGEVFVPPPGYGAIKSGQGWGSGRGDYDVYTYGIELSRGLSTTGIDLVELGCRIAEAHGYWDNKYTIGLSLSGDTILHVLNTQVDRGLLDQVLRSIGAL